VDVQQPGVTEVVVAPHPLQQLLATDRPPIRRGELDQQAELGPGQVHLGTGPTHHVLLGEDLEPYLTVAAAVGAVRLGWITAG
jgi:hypothetical protein